MKAIRNTKGFTMVEVVVVIGVVALLAGVLVPLISKNLEDAKRARAKNEAVVIAAAVGSLYKDTGMWPTKNKEGKFLDRLATDVNKVPQLGTWGWKMSKPVEGLGGYLFSNKHDLPTTGEFKWSGPYLDKPEILDPWGQSYVVNARYFPGNSRYGGTVKHRVYVLSAGPNRKWETPYNNNIGDGKDETKGDDIGVVVTVR